MSLIFRSADFKINLTIKNRNHFMSVVINFFSLLPAVVHEKKARERMETLISKQEQKNLST